MIGSGLTAKIPEDWVLGLYISRETLIRMFELIGFCWVNTSNDVGLNLSKFREDEGYRFRAFISRKFNIQGRLAKSLDNRYYILFPQEDSKTLVNLIHESLPLADRIKLVNPNFLCDFQQNKASMLFKGELRKPDLVPDRKPKP